MAQAIQPDRQLGFDILLDQLWAGTRSESSFIREAANLGVAVGEIEAAVEQLRQHDRVSA